MAGRLYLVATPIGNLEDITHRATRVLSEVDVIAAEDTRRTRQLLNHFGIEGKKLVSLFDGNEAWRTEELIERLSRGENIAVVTDAGTPGVSDPGERIARAAAEVGIEPCALPGASAPLVALVASGLPTAEFRFCGFPDRSKGARLEAFGKLRGERATLIFFEAPPRVGATLDSLSEAFGDERRAAVCRELTKVHEEIVRGTLAELTERYAESAPRGECTLVVEGAGDEPAEEFDVEDAIRTLFSDGLGPKQIAQRLVAKTGLPRRQIYQLALALRED